MSSSGASALKTPQASSTQAPGDAAVSGEIDVEFDDDRTRTPCLGAGAPDKGNVLSQGHVVGQYVVDHIIDIGGGGVVYAVHHHASGKRAALKALREDVASSPQMVARFAREAAAVNEIRHPNIVEIYEFGELGPGRPYFVMELLEGTDVRKLLRRHGRFSPQEVLDIFEPICNAVQTAHETGFVHRDIKSSNIVIGERDGERVVKLVDFGISKPIVEASGQGLTGPGLLVGTVHNMAPEQIRGGKVDARTDVYALGTLAFQMLTGHYPFDAGDPLEIVRLQLQAPPPRPSASAPVSAALDEVVLRCLEKAPERRYSSAAELLVAFQTALGQPSSVRGTATWAVGVYFELATGDEEDLDDDLLEDIGNVLDMMEQGLAASAFVCPFKASNALLGIRAVGTQTEADSQGQDVASILRDWKAIFARRSGRHPRLRVEARLTVGQALKRGAGAQLEIVGGPLLDFGAWKDPQRFRMI